MESRAFQRLLGGSGTAAPHYDGKMVSVSAAAKPANARRIPPRDSPLLSILFNLRAAWVNVFFFSFVLNALMLAPSIFSMQVYDRVISSRNEVTLLMLSAIALAAFAGTSALEWARSRIMVRIGLRFDHALGEQLLRLSHRINLEKSGTVGGRLLSDLFTVRSFLSGHAAVTIMDAPWVPIFFVVMFLLHPLLALSTAAGSAILIGLTVLTHRSTEGPLAKAGERGAEAMRYATVNLRNSEVIEAMGMFGALSERWHARQNDHLREQAMASDRAGLISAISRFVRTTNQNVAVVVGAYLVLTGDISMGAIFAASILASRMTSPIEQLIGTWAQWGNAREAWLRIDDAIRLREPEPAAVTLPDPTGELSLEGVAGGPPTAPPFLQNVTLKVPAGSCVAIIGSSAAGKSTLLRLVAGVWRPQTGTIRLDGADIHHWDRAKLGRHVGYLPQDVELLEGTIAENIARHQEVDSERVIAAAQAAGVHDLVLQMPGGYNTQVGANGAYLSGGQRQRIGLARALYGEPRLLILDEPNANLDDAGEAALDAALQKARAKGQTVLLVSHRPTAIRNCDLMMVLQSGQVTLYGPRDQVFAVLSKAAAATGKNGAAPAAGAPTPPPAVRNGAAKLASEPADVPA